MISPALQATRNDEINAFLARAGWKNARREKIPGDASFRHYERITQLEKRAILMDAPPEKEDVRPFIIIAECLTQQGFSAPNILAKEAERGLLLLEDLGDDLYSRLLSAPDKKVSEREIYEPAIDLLAELYQIRPAGGKPIAVPDYDEALYMRELHLLTEWYLPLAAPAAHTDMIIKEYDSLWRRALAKLPALPTMLVLRDYHADNLLWLPERKGTARVGLLDFQDAVWGNPAYDLVSLLEDARRDVAKETVAICLDRFATHTKIKRVDLDAAYAILGAQRNSKIIGIFCRLAQRDKKPRYLSMIPRVWKHLERDLTHPALSGVKAWYENYFFPSWPEFTKQTARDDV